MYNGEKLTYHEYTLISGVTGEQAIALIDRLQVDFTGEQTDVGSSENTFNSTVYRIDGGLDVTSNYDITHVYGTLTVTQRPITITTGSKTFVYSGEYYTFDNYSITGGEGLVSGHALITVVESLTKIKDVGVVENKIDVVVKSGLEENDYTHNYKITYEYGELEVIHKHVTIIANSDQKVYDGQPLTNNTFYEVLTEYDYPLGVEMPIKAVIEEHTIIADIQGSITEVGHVINKLISVSILDVNQQDVTSNYVITKNDGTLTVYGSELYVTPEEITVDYDGNEHAPANVSIREPYVLGEGHKVVATFEGSRIEPGITQTNIISVKVVDDNGEDVTENYLIQTGSSFVLIQIPIIIESASDEKVYDGTPLENPGYTITGTLTEGDTIDVTVSGTITDAGTAVNEISFTVNYANVYGYQKYRIEKRQGTLRVSQRVIYYRTEGASKRFDGLPLKSDSVTFSDPTEETGLLSGHSIVYDVVEIIYPYQSPKHNVITEFTVKDGGIDVSKNYKVMATEAGLLVITPIKINVTTASDQKEYDGLPLTNEGYDVTSADGEEIPIDHVFEVNVTGTITDPGQVKNTVTVNIYYGLVEVTDCYKINYNLGTLTVLEADQPDDPDDPKVDYDFDNGGDLDGNTSSDDAEQQKAPVYSVNAGYSEYIYLRGASYGDYYATESKSGWSNNPPVYEELGFNAMNFPYLAMKDHVKTESITVEILANAGYVTPYFTNFATETDLNDAKINNSSNYYQLSYIPLSKVDVSKYSLEGTPYSAYEVKYREFVEQNYTELPDTTKQEMLKIIAEKGFSKDNPNVIYDVAKFVQTYLPYDFNTSYVGDYAVYFFNGAETAICQHYATAATALYRALGIPARYTVGFVGSVSANEDSIIYAPGHAWVEVYINGFGWLPVEVTGSSSGGGGNGGGENDDNGGGNGGGDSDQLPKEFAIKPVDVVVEYVGPGQVVYAENEVEYADQTASLDIFAIYLARGYTYEVEVEGSLQGVYGKVNEGTSRITKFVFKDDQGNIVFSTESDENEFNITFEEGVMKITPPWIVIEVFYVEGTYDGYELSYEEDDWYYDSLPSFVSDIEFKLSGSLINPGKIDLNSIDLSTFVAYDLNGEVLERDVDYFVKIVGDPLEVLKIDLTVTSDSQQFIYQEGVTHVNKNFTISAGALLDGHRIEVTITGAQSDVGMSYNTISNVTVYDENDNDVTYLYDIDTVEGKLIVVN